MQCPNPNHHLADGEQTPGSARLTFTLRRQQGKSPSSSSKGRDGFHYAVVPSPKSPSSSPLRGSFGVFLERRSMIRALVRGFRVRRALKCKRFAVLKSQIEDSLKLLNEVEGENGGTASSSDPFVRTSLSIDRGVSRASPLCSRLTANLLTG